MIFVYGTITLFGSFFQMLSTNQITFNALCLNSRPEHTHLATLFNINIKEFRLFPVRSPLLRESSQREN